VPTWREIQLLTHDRVFVQIAMSTIARDDKMQLPLAEGFSLNTLQHGLTCWNICNEALAFQISLSVVVRSGNTVRAPRMA
jgi:hypothetical protein